MQKVTTRLVSLIKICLVMFPLCIATSSHANPDSIYRNGARSHIEALDLSWPQTTAKAFIAAWRSQDYESVYFTLTPETQYILTGVNMRLTFEDLFPTLRDHRDFWDGIRENLPEQTIIEEQNSSQAVDAMFMAAQQRGLLPFSFGPNAGIKSIKEHDGKIRVTITTDAPEPQEITLIMAQMKHSRNWKILKIEIPGFNAVSEFW